MTLGIFRGLLTLTLFVAFVVLWIWAWRKQREPEFADAARLPLIDDQPVTSQSIERTAP